MKTFYSDSKIKSIVNYLGEMSKEVQEKGYWNRADETDIKEGVFKIFYPNGQLELEGTYVSNEASGVFKTYYENGSLNIIGTYKNNLSEGERKIYFPNGNVYLIGLCSEGKLMDIITMLDIEGNSLDKGTLVNGDGTLKLYIPKGELIGEEEYVDGVKVEN